MGSGLFALLPSPKKQDKLIPQVATRRNKEDSYNNYKNMNNKKTICAVTDCVKTEGLNFVEGNDFFSLSNSENNITTRETPGVFQDPNMSEYSNNTYGDKEMSNVQTGDSLVMTESFKEEPLCPNTLCVKEFLQPVAAESFVPLESDAKLNDIAVSINSMLRVYNGFFDCSVILLKK